MEHIDIEVYEVDKTVFGTGKLIKTGLNSIGGGGGGGGGGASTEQGTVVGVLVIINVWYDIIWCAMIWYSMIWYETVWYNMIWNSMI